MHPLFKITAVLSIAIASLFAGGCASLVKGTTQEIPVSSNPTGANVKLDGNKVGQTPVRVEVKRKSDHLITIEKEGYEVENIVIKHSMEKAAHGNRFTHLLYGWAIDAIRGEKYNLTPATISVTLHKTKVGSASASESPSEAATLIAELRKLDKQLRSKEINDEEYIKIRAELMGGETEAKPEDTPPDNSDNE